MIQFGVNPLGMLPISIELNHGIGSLTKGISTELSAGIGNLPQGISTERNARIGSLPKRLAPN